MARYEALRHLTVGEDILAPGEIVESTEDDGRDWSAMVRLGEVREVASAAGDEPRDENGDTAEMAELRKILDAAFAKQGEEVERLKADVAERDATIAERDVLIDQLRRPMHGVAPDQSLTPASGSEDDDRSTADTSEGTTEPNPALGGGSADGLPNVEATPNYVVKDKGRGWFVVMQGETEVTKSLRADDVELFPAMTADEQGAFVEANAPAD